jgi:hypothetical protein
MSPHLSQQVCIAEIFSIYRKGDYAPYGWDEWTERPTNGEALGLILLLTDDRRK